MFDNSKHTHFIGMGGSGMTALVRLALSKAVNVSGSDGQDSPILDEFRQLGATVHVGHDASQVPAEATLVIYSEAVDRGSNPEYLEAMKRRIPCLTYFEALGELSKTHKTIAVAGTHGKTTTTAMLGAALVKADIDPLVIVGSRVPEFGGRNLYIGRSDWFVVEACEYRRSFLSLEPFGVVLLNCEPDHMDYYKNEDDYVSAFEALVAKIPENGFLVTDLREPNSAKVASKAKCLVIDAGGASESAPDLQIPGNFNKENALKALLAAKETGADVAVVSEALGQFKGTARRMEMKGEVNGVLVMDDYGHHPTEVRATLGALKEKYPDKRLVCVFQPHQYSRTIELLEDFKSAFANANVVIVPNIYEARDSAEDKQKMSAERFVRELRHRDARHGNDLNGTLAILYAEAKPGDLVVTMGAGDVYKIGEEFLRR